MMLTGSAITKMPETIATDEITFPQGVIGYTSEDIEKSNADSNTPS